MHAYNLVCEEFSENLIDQKFYRHLSCVSEQKTGDFSIITVLLSVPVTLNAIIGVHNTKTC